MRQIIHDYQFKERNKLTTGKRRYRYSGFNHCSPSDSSQLIFSQVVIISPKEASTIVFPVSREDILMKEHKLEYVINILMQ